MLCMGLGSQRLCMGLSDCVWVSAIVYGSQRLCMGLSNYIWVSAIVYGSQR